MKRDPALVPLSHDHHQTLMAAQRLKRGESAYPALEDRRESVLRLWERELEPHFSIEERLLYGKESPQGMRELVDRALAEHVDIGRRVEEIRQGRGSDEGFRELGERLVTHIRFEERELFQALQDCLDEGQLARLGLELAALHRPPACDIRTEKHL